MEPDFDFNELKTMKRRRGLNVHVLRSWICCFMRAYQSATGAWPKTNVIANTFGYHPVCLRAEHLAPMVRLGFLEQAPMPYSSLTRYIVIKDYEYELPAGLGAACETFEEGVAQE